MRSFPSMAAAIGLLAVLVPPSLALAAPAPPRSTPIAPSEDRLVLPAPKHARRLVVVVADNRGAEVTDFVVPYGVLSESGVAEVRSLSLAPGPVRLRGALSVLADQTLADFDLEAPEGADVVIVPAMVHPKDPALLAWLRDQAAKGAVIMSICEGARVTAAAGLLDGRRATSHWSSLKDLTKAYPTTVWVRDRRYVQDGRVISTTGVAASIPASLALVEAIGGPEAARATADRLGVSGWSAEHRTVDFRIGKVEYARAVMTVLALWTHETVEMPVEPGEDEIGLALRADVWTRSYRTKIVVTSASAQPVRSRRGLMIVPDAKPKRGRLVIRPSGGPAAGELETALVAMGRRYGPAAVRLAKSGLEYDAPGS